MTARSLAAGGMAAFILIVAGVSAWSAFVQESDSAFVEGGAGPRPLLVDAREQGLETLRLVTGPHLLLRENDRDASKVLLVIVAPRRPFSADDAKDLESFLMAGGKALIADNFGQANTLTAPLGIRFERVRLVDPGLTQVLMKVGRASFQVWAPSPTAIRLDPAVAGTVVANSSTSSFLDRDGDGLIGKGDPPGPFEAATSVAVGARGGRIVAIGDPSVFLPSGADRLQDRAFRSALLSMLLPDGGRVVVDESRLPARDPWLTTVSVVSSALSTQPWAGLAEVLAVCTLAFGVMGASMDFWGFHRSGVDHFVRRSALSQPGDGAQQGAVPETHAGVRWTLRGRTAIFGGFALLVVGIATDSLQATFLASFFLLAAAIAMLARPGRVHAERSMSADKTDEGGEVTVTLAIQAQAGGHGHVEILDELPREFSLDSGHNWFQVPIGSRSRLESAYMCGTALRGYHQVGPLRMRSMDPFRLRAFETIEAPRMPVLVRPRSDPLTRIPFKSKTPQMTLGPHLVNRAGEGMEFRALRPYQTGDSIRSVNWKASARSKELVVNQRVHESMATLAVFLDGRTVSAAGVNRVSPLNEGARAAISLIEGAMKARDKVRLFVYGDGISEIPAGPGPHDAHEVANALAAIKANGSTGFKDALAKVLPTLRGGNPAVLISGFEADSTVVAGMTELAHRGFLPVAVSMAIGTEPTRADDGSAEPDAQRLQKEHTLTIAELHAAGIPVVPSSPGTPLAVLLRLGVS